MICSISGYLLRNHNAKFYWTIFIFGFIYLKIAIKKFYFENCYRMVSIYRIAILGNIKFDTFIISIVDFIESTKYKKCIGYCHNN